MGNEVKTGGPRLKAPGVGWLIHTLGGGVSIEAESFSVALLRNKVCLPENGSLRRPLLLDLDWEKGIGYEGRGVFVDYHLLSPPPECIGRKRPRSRCA